MLLAIVLVVMDVFSLVKLLEDAGFVCVDGPLGDSPVVLIGVVVLEDCMLDELIGRRVVVPGGSVAVPRDPVEVENGRPVVEAGGGFGLVTLDEVVVGGGGGGGGGRVGIVVVGPVQVGSGPVDDVNVGSVSVGSALVGGSGAVGREDDDGVEGIEVLSELVSCEVGGSSIGG